MTTGELGSGRQNSQVFPVVLTLGILSFHTVVPWSSHNHPQIFKYSLWGDNAKIYLSDLELFPILQIHSHPLLAVYLHLEASKTPQTVNGPN